MSIKKIHLENFKCFKSLDIEFGKITLLLGANSGGKSTTIQSYLLPFQSQLFPIKLTTNGKYSKTGDYEDTVYMHNKKNNIVINYTALISGFEYTVQTRWKYDKQNKLPVLDELKISSVHLEYLIKHNGINYRLNFKYNKDKDPLKEYESRYKMSTRIFEMFKNDVIENENGTYDKILNEIVERFKKNKQKTMSFIVEDINDIVRIARDKGNFVLSYYLDDIFRYFNEDENINFIDSFRYNPQKIKYDSTNQNLTVAKSGENYEDQILTWETQKSKQYHTLVNSMKRLKLFDAITNNRTIGGTYNFKIKTHRGGVFSSITDVGFGISQFLPIIVADIQLGKNSTLLISQPEIHLHPSVQSDYGDYIVEKVITDKKTYVIETHSEYLINKLRLLIVSGLLSEDDVKVYFFNNKGKDVVVDRIIYKKNGSIENAPPEYFKTYMTDVMQIAINSTK